MKILDKFSKNPIPTKVIRTVFTLAAIFALGFVIFEFSRHWPTVSKWRPSLSDLIVFGMIAAAYGVSLYLLAEAWHRLLYAFKPQALSRANAYNIFAKTQIAKYLPGNVFHLAGRNILAAEKSIEHKLLLKITAMEIVLMVATALLVACIAAFMFLDDIPGINVFLTASIFTYAVFAMYFVVFLFSPGTVFQRFKSTALPLVYMALFFCLYGLFFLVILSLLDVNSSPESFVSAPLSWLAGFVTPGAPGGLGTRELSMYYLLSFSVSEAQLLLSIALFRLVTLIGDLLFFLSGRFIIQSKNGTI